MAPVGEGRYIGGPFLERWAAPQKVCFLRLIVINLNFPMKCYFIGQFLHQRPLIGLFLYNKTQPV